jgi:hypothetical protein
VKLIRTVRHEANKEEEEVMTSQWLCKDEDDGGGFL